MVEENTCTCRGSVTAGDKSRRKRALGELNTLRPCLKTRRIVVAIQIQRAVERCCATGVVAFCLYFARSIAKR